MKPPERSRFPVYRTLLFIAAVLAAVVTPTTDVLTMLLVWLPLAGLLCAGAALVSRSSRR